MKNSFLEKFTLAFSIFTLAFCLNFLNIQDYFGEIIVEKIYEESKTKLQKPIYFYTAKDIKELKEIDKKLENIGISKQNKIAVIKNISIKNK